MKKLLQLSAFIVTVSIIVTSCSNTKAVTATRTQLLGTWMVSHVEVEGIDASKLNITSFDDAAMKCFEGSEWYLPNSGYGKYTIAKADCRGGERRIIWSQRVRNGITYFNFKHLDDIKKKDAKRVEEGYSLEVAHYEKNHFTAKSPVVFEGKTINIVYHFEKK